MKRLVFPKQGGWEGQDGLTLRQHYAINILNGLISEGRNVSDLIKDAFYIADTMIQFELDEAARKEVRSNVNNKGVTYDEEE